MTTDTEDRSTWPRNGKPIRRDELLRLIEENGGPEDLDLRGAGFFGDRQEKGLRRNPIDLSPGALAGLAAAYKEKHGGSQPPWLSLWPDGVALGGARLQEADLGGAQLQGSNLFHAQLQGAHLRGAQLQGAYLRGARLQEADLSQAQLQGAHVMGARLQGADLRGTQLQGAHLRGAQLQGADLRGAQLERVDMYGVASLVGAHWGRAFLEYTRIDRRYLRQSIGDEDEAHRHGSAEPEDKHWKASAYSDASEAYLLLKNNFNQIGRYEDASWAYVKEQQMEKMAHYWRWRAWGQEEKSDDGWEWRSWGWKVWRAWGPFSRWLRNWVYELATGYGERVYMPILWAIVVVAVFAGIYAVAGNIASGDVGSLQGQPTHNPLTALVHSISAFATIGFNTLEPQGWGARLLTALEAMFGVGLFALFIFTLGNRMSRS